MGLFPSSEFKNTHFLHYTKFGENKLYVYLPEKDILYTFSILHKGRKFKFYGQRTISTPSGSIFLIGGQSIQVLPDEEDLLFSLSDIHASLSMSNFVANINLENHRNFKIDLNDMERCEALPEARSQHAMVYSEPHIFVIGGEVANSGPTKSCLKFHTKTRKWEKISDMKFSANLIEPCGIALNESIYVFNTSEKNKFPRVYRYSIELDQWMEILVHMRNKDLVIPPTLSSAAYQISEKEVMIVGGVRSDKNDQDKRDFWYVFDSLTEEIKEFTYQEMGKMRKETQGYVDYSVGDTVYGKLGERQVKFFNKENKVWGELRVIPENNNDNFNFGCCSNRRVGKLR